MKSNLKTKGWANPISVSVMLLAIILSLALFALHRIELSIIFMVALGLCLYLCESQINGNMR